MATPISHATAPGAPDSTEAAAQQMEAAFLRQLLTASGAFKPADVAGGQLRADMFIETLADAVAKGGGIGIARMLEDEIDKTGKDRLKPGAKTAEAKHPTDVIDDGPDDDPASFAARKPEIGTTRRPTREATRHCAYVPHRCR